MNPRQKTQLLEPLFADLAAHFYPGLPHELAYCTLRLTKPTPVVQLSKHLNPKPDNGHRN